MIKLVTQAHISNILLRNNNIRMVDKKRSQFHLQLSCRAVAMPDKGWSLHKAMAQTATG